MLSRPAKHGLYDGHCLVCTASSLLAAGSDTRKQFYCVYASVPTQNVVGRHSGAGGRNHKLYWPDMGLAVDPISDGICAVDGHLVADLTVSNTAIFVAEEVGLFQGSSSRSRSLQSAPRLTLDVTFTGTDLDSPHAAQWIELMTRSAVELLEISDSIVDFKRTSFDRLAVRKAATVKQLLRTGDMSAARLVQRMPEEQGCLDADYIDALLVRVHCEMQRLSEEFQHGRRVYESLCFMISVLQASGVLGPFRIVDIGCGTSYVMRWLVAREKFDQNVELRSRLQRGFGGRSGTTCGPRETQLSV